MGSTRIFNIVSGIFLVLTVLVIVFIGVKLVGPPAEQPVNVAALPSLVPSATPIPPTPTFTQGPPTLPPTFTPTSTNTPIPSSTPTLTPTIAPSSTITPTETITPTPAESPTPTLTLTNTPSLTPTGPTLTWTPSVSPFPFQLRDSEVPIIRNTFNSAGCAWEGVGGQVFDINGNEHSPGNLVVHVYNNQVDRTVAVGTNSIYGPISGWEIALDNKINTNFYFVQLETTNGTVISPRVEIQFPGDCDHNVALVRFIQVR